MLGYMVAPAALAMCLYNKERTMQIVCLNKISEKGLCCLDDKYVVANNMESCDAVLVRSAAMHDMKFATELKAIARAGAGVNNIPIDRCTEQGIVVFNTPGANANAVKELTITGLLLASRDVIGALRFAQELKGSDNINAKMEANKGRFVGHEIRDKTLAVIGLGAIGVLVANAAHALGMNVVGYDPYLSVQAAWALSRSIHHADSMEDALREADYVTVHVPLNDATRGSINASVLNLMRPGVRLLNFARGEIVCQSDLLEALDSGHIAAYVTDFPTEELLGHENVITIPHLGASTEESEENCAVMAVRQLRDYLENGNIHNSVNFPDCDMGKRSTPCRVLLAHKNIPNLIGAVTGVLSSVNMNISHMSNRSRKELAYTMLDLDAMIDEKTERRLQEVPGMIRVRVLQ